MQKLSIKRLVEFKGKSDRSKKTFAASLKKDKQAAESEGGGDYWISCLSAISSAYKANDLELIIERKDDLEVRLKSAEHSRTKTMYKRNIKILYNYEDHDFKNSIPVGRIKFLKKPKSYSVLSLREFQVQVTPHHVFTFEKDGKVAIGAIWFVAKLNGLKKDETGMFADILYRYLKTHYSKNYELSAKYCIAVDVVNDNEVNYSQLEKGGIPMILDSLLSQIRKLM